MINKLMGMAAQAKKSKGSIGDRLKGSMSNLKAAPGRAMANIKSAPGRAKANVKAAFSSKVPGSDRPDQTYD